MTTKPTVLFVHGSWHTPEHFQPVRDVFEQAGYPTACPQQPSVGNLPPIGMQDDAKRIMDELSKLIEHEEKDVVVVAHSYGGIVSTQGVDARFSKATREELGKKGDAVRLIYLAAFIVSVGSSLSTPFGGAIPPFIAVDEREMCLMKDPADRFYHDLPPSEQTHWVQKLLYCPASTQLTPITQAAYLSRPVSYIYCELDRALPYPAQKQMVSDVSEQYKISIPTSKLEASHSPFLSMPEQLLAAVEEHLE